MTLIREHLTETGDGAVAHFWSVGEDGRLVSLSAKQVTSPVVLGLLGPLPDLSQGWLFDVFQVRTPAVGCGDGAGDVDSLSAHLARPVWNRLQAAGMTEAAVFAELEQLWHTVLGEEGL